MKQRRQVWAAHTPTPQRKKQMERMGGKYNYHRSWMTDGQLKGKSIQERNIFLKTLGLVIGSCWLYSIHLKPFQTTCLFFNEAKFTLS